MSERRLSEIAKVLRQPEGIVGSEFTRINKAARKAGIRFDLWQQGFLWLLFAKNAEGKYACGADGAALSSCRQIGKTFTVGDRTIEAVRGVDLDVARGERRLVDQHLTTGRHCHIDLVGLFGLLGGVGPLDRQRAWQAGAQGVAGIRAFWPV